VLMSAGWRCFSFLAVQASPSRQPSNPALIPTSSSCYLQSQLVNHMINLNLQSSNSYKKHETFCLSTFTFSHEKKIIDVQLNSFISCFFHFQFHILVPFGAHLLHLVSITCTTSQSVQLNGNKNHF
jgi:hypothetical protein